MKVGKPLFIDNPLLLFDNQAVSGTGEHLSAMMGEEQSAVADNYEPLDYICLLYVHIYSIIIFSLENCHSFDLCTTPHHQHPKSFYQEGILFHIDM